MGPSIKKLSAIASPSIGGPIGATNVLDKWGAVGKQLAELLAQKNGFYAYESALLVRPLQHANAPLGVLEWNEVSRWKAAYDDDLNRALFFAEDVFGGQFCIHEDSVCTFDPETGQIEMMATSLDDWARMLMSDYEFCTGFPLAHAWQMTNGALPPGVRLLPKLPFVCGGKYELENLYSLQDVQGMQMCAAIANQVRDLPDGAPIVFKGSRPSA